MLTTTHSTTTCEFASRAHPSPPDPHAPRQILLGCLSGDSGCDNKNAQGVYTKRVNAGGLSRLVTLPKDKLCAYCVLQWIWEARNDGGHYVQCVDMAITETGKLAPPPGLPPRSPSVL